MTKQKIPWDNIRKDYVLGITDKNGLKTFPTYEILSENYNVALGTIKNRGSKEKWTQQRKSHKVKVTKKVIEKKSHSPEIVDIDEVEADEAAEYDAENIVISDANFEETGEKLRQAVQADLETYLNFGVSNPYHLKMLGDALSSAQSVVKAAQGEILERIGVETNTNNGNDELLNDPDYIAAKRKAMDDFYHAKSRKS